MIRRREAPNRERGMTLIELLVAISLLAVATTLITTLVVTVSQTFAREESQQDSSRNAALGMQQITRIVRGGTEVPQALTWQPLSVFDAASANSMTIHTYLDTATTESGPARITLSVNSGGELIQTRVVSRAAGTGWTFAGQPATSRVIVRDVAPAGTRIAGSPAPSMFTYLKADGTPFSLPSGTLTEQQRREVVAVRVSLVIQTQVGGTAAPAQLVSTVGIPNLNQTRTGS